jgi:hypothetical protein
LTRAAPEDLRRRALQQLELPFNDHVARSSNSLLSSVIVWSCKAASAMHAAR